MDVEAGKQCFEGSSVDVSDEDEPTLAEKVAASRRASATCLLKANASVSLQSQTPVAQATVRKGASVSGRVRKDCPREIPSRRPVPYGRDRCLGILQNSGRVQMGRERPVDPRFEPQCGTLSEEHASRNFQFVDKIRNREKVHIRKELRADPGNDALRAQVRAIEGEEARRRAHTRRKEIRANLMREEKDKVKRGKKPFYPKNSAVREKELEMKYADLKAVGGVRKYIEKRRKRNAGKDRKLLLKRRGSRE